MTPSVAVIIPTFNRRHCLGRALDSVFAQTLAPTEVCVIDDGSRDGTEALVRRNFPSVRYLYQANRGVSAARNAGIAATGSEWLAFLDSDDEWLPQKLERQFALLDSAKGKPDHPLIHCDEIWIRNGVRVNPMVKHEKAGGRLFNRCLPLCVISPSATLLQRSLLDEVGLFDESLPACEDYDLWLRICSRFPVLYVNEPLLRKYGGHADQLSRRYWGMDRFRVRALDKLLSSAVLDTEQRRAARAMLLNKSEILINGAGKRDNRDLAEACQALLNKYNHARYPIDA